MAARSQADDREFVRLRAENLALKTRNLELEEALLACTQRGIRLEEVLRYRDDVPGPPDLKS